MVRPGTACVRSACARPDGGSSRGEALTLSGAKTVAAAAVAEANRLNAPGGAIAIVDAGGHLLDLERLDNTFRAAAGVAEAKARTAALFGRPTKGIEDAIVGGRTTLLNVAADGAHLGSIVLRRRDLERRVRGRFAFHHRRRGRVSGAPPVRVCVPGP